MFKKQNVIAGIVACGLLVSEGAQMVTSVFAITQDETSVTSSAEEVGESTTTTTTETESGESEEVTEAMTEQSSASTTTEAEAVPEVSSTTTETTSTESSQKSSAEAETSQKVTSAVTKAQTEANQPAVSEKVIGPQEEKPSQPSLSSLDSALFILDGGLTVVNGSTYVEHWTGKDAYTHNILSHRYGITAEQLDGFLKSTGIQYDSERFNGKKILEWEKESGLDARAIIAIAMSESSLGTAGVAREKGANAFGYGAFDDNPDNAKVYNDDVAIKQLTQVTIIKNQNTSFKRQDEKALKNASGKLDVSKEGGVYFTDTTGSGKRRAQIMEKIDKWIDEHGGTPEIPDSLKVVGISSVSQIPTGFNISKPIDSSGYAASAYPWGQCTWYVYNRALELGTSFGAFMGNGGDWQSQAGYETTHVPAVGYAVSFSPGQAGADGKYGHVAIVEEVKEDGSILISESNVLGLGNVSYRTFKASEAKQLTYVKGHDLD
ncbi:CHAP domain-containing protein [Streptococcus ferus]|uniref:CHAP domain-containing protein n=1 Tax=Streptococcus ferus TaxID=1345 RepID=UPI0035156326